MGDGDGVHINHAKDAFVFVLEFNPIFDGAEVVSQMEVARRLDSGKNSFFHKV